MDLIDASNAPVPITVDPITGNTISANGAENTMEDTQMADPEDHTNAADDEAEDYDIDNSPTFIDFTTLPADTKATITRLLASAGANWLVRSMATPFPLQYLPDPDCHNWGLALISALNRLADMTRSGHRDEAIAFIIKHMKERNEVPGNTEDESKMSSNFEGNWC
ncbi:hypothetical protein J4E93_003265 [Alternaria ventricosa]|uniref:uncharacterized protein n=1 Tax=Alternaria ventricosa TaxID=1187951 RepID=UPI0020C550DD|nr:uncharacterized protein J4E93_003265 [Alternaria ventricosa]KAI4650908.1 hypothetical protein J4E93_003265 [Alternaria ventricosa]